ncbi:hypothetical protein C8R45DRAFT_1100762 [Mycena sanguinolenta]|nr:hypothetical protein C8R45DRAFT_1100762 [Mycena sanguinolenta]
MRMRTFSLTALQSYQTQKSFFLSRFHSCTFTQQLHLSSFYKNTVPLRAVRARVCGRQAPSRCEARRATRWFPADARSTARSLLGEARAALSAGKSSPCQASAHDDALTRAAVRVRCWDGALRGEPHNGHVRMPAAGDSPYGELVRMCIRSACPCTLLSDPYPYPHAYPSTRQDMKRLEFEYSKTHLTILLMSNLTSNIWLIWLFFTIRTTLPVHTRTLRS